LVALPALAARAHNRTDSAWCAACAHTGWKSARHVYAPCRIAIVRLDLW